MAENKPIDELTAMETNRSRTANAALLKSAAATAAERDQLKTSLQLQINLVEQLLTEQDQLREATAEFVATAGDALCQLTYVEQRRMTLFQQTNVPRAVSRLRAVIERATKGE